jgi:hypothetical protein
MVHPNVVVFVRKGLSSLVHRHRQVWFSSKLLSKAQTPSKMFLQFFKRAK